MLDLLSYAVLFILLLVILFYFWWENSEFVRLIDQIPGPPKQPFVGNILSVPHDGPGNNQFLSFWFIELRL